MNSGMVTAEKYFKEGRGPDLRKAKNGRKRTWVVNPEDIWDLHHEIKRLILLGWKGARIAEHLNCTPATVSSVRNSPVIKDQLALMRGARDAATVDLARQIEEVAPHALANLREVVEEGTVKGEKATTGQIIKESNSLLDRHVGKAALTIRSENIHAHFTADEIIKMKDRARGIAPDRGETYDGETRESPAEEARGL